MCLANKIETQTLFSVLSLCTIANNNADKFASIELTGEIFSSTALYLNFLANA